MSPDHPQPRALPARPAGVHPATDTWAIALEVILAAVDGSRLTPQQQLAWAGWGQARPTLERLITQAFRHPASTILLLETQQIGAIDSTDPVRLERRVAFPSTRLFLEALILPCEDRQAAELSALLRRGPSSAQRHQAALAYIRALEERWACGYPARMLPAVDLRRNFPVIRAADAPACDPETEPVLA